MKIFDKKSEKIVWLSLLISIPFLVLVLWKENEEFGRLEIIISLITLLIGIGIFYIVKLYANKN
jgi:hypothetical protein